MQQDRLHDVITRIDSALGWVPEWVVALVLLAFASAAALAIHALLVYAARRSLVRHPFVLSMLRHTRGPSRLALMIVAWLIVLPSAPLDDRIAAVVGHLLSLSIVVLCGWIAMRAVNVAATLYLRRFRLDVEDNLLARKHITQVRILTRAANTLIVMIAVSAALMTFESVRQYGVSLFASAGAAGLIVGLAARPILSNLIGGVQLAITQPIRIDDAVIVENEFGWIEEITSTYVVIRLWDWRRLVVPLSYFIEKPFQNWTREGSALIGTVFLYLDYSVPIDALRRKAEEIVRQSKLWDGRVVNLQVSDAKESTIEVRVLVSARSAPAAWDLRCEVREKLIAFLRQEHPDALPRTRTEVHFENAPPLAPREPEGVAAIREAGPRPSTPVE
jgi:small-conductance mechanosensitive channel